MAEATNLAHGLMQYMQPLELSKSKAEENAYLFSELVKEGHLNALDLSTKLQYIVDVCSEARKMIREDAVQEMGKYDKKETVTVNGTKVEVAETGISYDYSMCGDPQWARLTLDEGLLVKQRKEREKFLRTLTKPMGVCDEYTDGETIVINPPIKTSTTNVKITFPK